MNLTIENCIVKYLNNEATIQEIELLENWLNNAENELVFKEYIKTNYLIDIHTMHFDKGKLLEELASQMKKDKRLQLQQTVRSFYKYAAILVLFISAYLGYNYFFNTTTSSSLNAINEVVLKSENGLITVLNQEGEQPIKRRDGQVIGNKINNSLVYQNDSNVEQLVYNTLTVPYGRQFSLQLSDGTHIQLNAGTSLRFPEKFIKGKPRTVFIEYGEAFFDVAKDENHPFIVNNNSLAIQVLGTQFNVSAYPEDGAVSTVLVEGSVQLTEASISSSEVVLQPGFQAVWNQNQNNFDIKEADIDMHTGWRSGKIVLKSLPFQKMITKLQRHYDVQITSNNQQLNNEIITATFDEEDIEEVLKLINQIHPINYTIEGRKINISANQ